MLIKNKELNNMTTFTKNQIEAIKLFNDHVEQSDFWAEKDCNDLQPTDISEYIYMDEAINLLNKNGWTVESAEGTIGSLMGKVIYEYDYCLDRDRMVYAIDWIDLDNLKESA
jgi:hypothetical protein